MISGMSCWRVPDRDGGAVVSGPLYWWRASVRGCWRPALAVALVGGLLGAVALAAVAGARRTSSAYDRYLASVNASDVLVSTPGRLPGVSAGQLIRLISGLPGITSSAAFLGLNAEPVFHGRVDDSYLTNGLNGSVGSLRAGGEFFGQDRMTVLAGQLPPPGSATEIVLTPGIARRFGARVGGRVSYALRRMDAAGQPAGKMVVRTYRVAAIADDPPVLVDDSDQVETGVLPPGATRQLLPEYGYAAVGLRLVSGPAGIPALQDHLAALARRLEQKVRRGTGQQLPPLSFDVSRADVIRGQVQQAIRPQAVALTIFGVIAALAMIVLTGQGFSQLVSRSARDISVARVLGATRAQAALAASLPGIIALTGGMVLAVAGAVALSPLAPVGPVRRFDPARGVQADGVVLGAGAAVLAVSLLGLLAIMVARTARPSAGPAGGRPSAIARAAASAGLPVSAVVGTRNALEPGSGARPVPVRSALLGSVAAVTAVVCVVVFGTSLDGLISHPVRYGRAWDVLIQAEGGYGSFAPGSISRLLAGQPSVAGWSEFAFTQLRVGGKVTPVLGLRRQLGSVEPPVTSGRPIAGNHQIALGTVTLRELGKKIGDTVTVGAGSSARPFIIAGTVTLPSFGQQGADHVSLGRGAMLSEAALLAATGTSATQRPDPQIPLPLPSAVAIRLAPGTTAAQRERLVNQIVSANPDTTPGGTQQLTRSMAAAVVNAAQMGRQQLALALSLAAAAVVSLALTVLASVRRRRHELALLKALGMTRGQVRAITAWQTTLTLLIALAAGLPLGIVAGRWAWRSFAASLGVVPVTVIPLLVLAAGSAALIAAANSLALVPAALAARTPPGTTLHTE
ncbi:MAG: putative transport system permease protein [Streptosporangiaceae bacterium]|jgi:hypothetical protein|nr:putative transport system permease protein [Streptosporangiaceae bacterium]